jgi:hypothetical protein
MHTGEPLFGGSDQADQMCRIGERREKEERERESNRLSVGQKDAKKREIDRRLEEKEREIERERKREREQWMNTVCSKGRGKRNELISRDKYNQ